MHGCNGRSGLTVVDELAMLVSMFTDTP